MSSMAPAADRPSTLGVWWAAARPATLTASIAPVAVGTGLAHADGVLRPDAAMAALLGAMLIQIGTNFFNDYADFEKGADTEDRLGPARAAQKGWLTPRQVLAGAILAFAAAVAVGSYLVWLHGWPLVAIGLLSVACGVAYTGGPFPLAYVGLGDLFVMLFFGLVAVGGTYFVQAGTVSAGALLAGTAVGALGTGILVVNNLRDRHTDAAANKRTLVVRFGAAFARWEYTLLVGGAFVAVVVSVVLELAPRGTLLALGALPLAAREIRAVWRKDGAALNAHLGGTARLQLVFSLLLAGGCLP